MLLTPLTPLTPCEAYSVEESDPERSSATWYEAPTSVETRSRGRFRTSGGGIDLRSGDTPRRLRRLRRRSLRAHREPVEQQPLQQLRQLADVDGRAQLPLPEQ